MADTGWLYPASAVNTALTTNPDWTSVSNVAAGAAGFNDDAPAACAVSAGGVTDRLDITWNLAGAIPENAVVLGVTLELRRRTAGLGSMIDSVVRFRYSGSDVGSSLAAAGDLGGAWGAAYETETWGGEKSRLGLAQASGHFSGLLTLRVVAEELGIDAATAQVDGARLKIHYGATPFYCDQTASSDGDGSAAAPFNTLATLNTALTLAQANSESCDAYAYGRFEENLAISSATDWTVQPMPGKTPLAVKILPCPLPSQNPWLYSTATPPQTSIIPIYWEATCGRLLPTSGWTDAGSGRWTRALAATPLHVCEDWLLTDQTPKGYLTAQASTAAVEANDSSWFHSGGTLSISASDGSDPNSNGKRYSYGAAGATSGSTRSNILLTACTRVTLRGFAATRNTGPVPKGADTTQPWGVQADGCTDCVMEQFGIYDTAFHGVGTGGVHSGIVYRNGIIAGCRSGSDGWSGIVFYGSSGAVSGRGLNLFIDLYTLLTPAGTPVTNDLGAAAIQTHANGTTSTVTDVEYRQVTARCRAYSTYKTFGRIMDVSESFAEPDDYDEWTDYPARIVDCDFLGFMPHFMGSLSDANPHRIAFKRCRFDFGQLAQATGGPIAWTMMTPSMAALFEDCLIYGDASAVASARHLLYLRGAGIELRLYGNTLCGVISSSGACAIVNTNEATAIVRAEGNVMGWIGTAGYLTLCDAGGARTVGELASSEDDRYSDNMIFGIRTTDGYSQNTSYNSNTEFTTAAPSNLVDVTTGLTAANVSIGNARLNTGSRSRRKKLARRLGEESYNGVRYAGQYGAWQESSGATRTRSRRAIVR